MAGAFSSLDLACDECGDQGSEEPKHGYKVLQQRHLCKKCARRIAEAILSDVAAVDTVKWPCTQHRMKELDLHCSQCQEVICHTCALTTHRGHELEDIQTFVNRTKETVRKQVTDMSTKQAEAKSYLEKIAMCTKGVEERFGGLRETLASSLQQKLDRQEEKRRSEVERANHEAEEEIRKITEKRDAFIADIDNNAGMLKDKLENNNKSVLQELEDIESKFCHKTSELELSAKKMVDELNATQLAANTILTAEDNKTLVENATRLQKLSLESLPALNCNILEILSKMANKVRITKQDDKQSVGTVEGSTRSYELTKTVSLPTHIYEPHLIRIIDESTVAIGDGPGTAAYSVNTDTEVIKVLIHPDSGIGFWDIGFKDGKLMAYSDLKTGAIRVCDLEANPMMSIILPSDASRYAYLTLCDGKIFAADHGDGNIYVVDPVGGTHLRTMLNKSREATLSLGSLKSGNLVSRSGPAEIVILDQSGATKRTISFEEWSAQVFCHVGDDNMIYVSYRNEPTPNTRPTGWVGVISADGTVRRENVIEFPTSWKHRYPPLCVVPIAGTVIILNGRELLVYKETPGIEDLVNMKT